jgi:hypothetical protein
LSDQHLRELYRPPNASAARRAIVGDRQEVVDEVDQSALAAEDDTAGDVAHGADARALGPNMDRQFVPQPAQSEVHLVGIAFHRGTADLPRHREQFDVGRRSIGTGNGPFATVCRRPPGTFFDGRGCDVGHVAASAARADALSARARRRATIVWT